MAPCASSSAPGTTNDERPRVLTEPQIQRYARQILLREVGGRGQSKLLALAVQVTGQGAALDVAAEYLAAGGARLAGVSGPGQFRQGAALGDFAPDAALPDAEVATAELAAGTHAFSRPGPWVALAGPRVAWRGVDGCAECFRRTVAAWPANEPLAPGEDVIVGTLAALSLQDLALGQAPALGAAGWLGGRLERLDVVSCPAHASP